MTKRIFKNTDWNNAFDKKGYISIPLLSEGKMQSLKALSEQLTREYLSVDKNVESDYDLSFFRQSPEIKKRIFDRIWEFFKPELSHILPDYEPLIINMFNKVPGTGEVPIHQNWTFVDEDQYTTVSVWIPLCNVSRENGTLEVVPGTHKNVSKFRSPSIPWVFHGLEHELKEKYMVPLELKEGEVGIIDDSVIHYSSDNHSDKNRPTIQLIMKPEAAPALHYLGMENDPQQIKVYRVDSEFFRSFDMNSREIDGKLIEEKRINNPKISEADLERIYSEAIS